MNIGVIGIGKLGSIHARIYRESVRPENLYICDTDALKLDNLASQFCAIKSNDYRGLAGKVDAVSIATPTCSHFEIAKFFLLRKVACLIEKPITTNLNDAKYLLNLAEKQKTPLLVGMIERFNTAYQKVKNIISQPKFIECHRLSPFTGRSTDISVVLDLMIHDLDIILDLVGDSLKKIDAVGVRVLSANPDIANVRLKFQGGCIANITSSRISDEKVRKIRVFFSSSYVSLDYAGQEAKIYRKTKKGIDKKRLLLARDEPLRKEIKYFVGQLKRKVLDYTVAEQSTQALGLALKIENSLKDKKRK